MTQDVLIADGPAQPNPAAIETFWQRACDQNAALGSDYQVRSIGIDAETTEQIFAYIKTQEKVATFSLDLTYEAFTNRFL